MRPKRRRPAGPVEPRNIADAPLRVRLDWWALTDPERLHHSPAELISTSHHARRRASGVPAVIRDYQDARTPHETPGIAFLTARESPRPALGRTGAARR